MVLFMVFRPQGLIRDRRLRHKFSVDTKKNGGGGPRLAAERETATPAEDMGKTADAHG